MLRDRDVIHKRPLGGWAVFVAPPTTQADRQNVIDRSRHLGISAAMCLPPPAAGTECVCACVSHVIITLPSSSSSSQQHQAADTAVLFWLNPLDPELLFLLVGSLLNKQLFPCTTCAARINMIVAMTVATHHVAKNREFSLALNTSC